MASTVPAASRTSIHDSPENRKTSGLPAAPGRGAKRITGTPGVASASAGAAGDKAAAVPGCAGPAAATGPEPGVVPPPGRDPGGGAGTITTDEDCAAGAGADTADA